jgi:hypothetical protein
MERSKSRTIDEYIKAQPPKRPLIINVDRMAEGGQPVAAV